MAKHRRSTRKSVKGGCGSCMLPLAGGANESLVQGGQFLQAHVGQHGGMAPLSAISDSSLPTDMRIAARVTPLDANIGATRGMSDQSGAGRKRRKHSKRAHRKTLRKTKRSTTRKARKSTRRVTRRTHRKHMKGGSVQYNPLPAPTDASGMLLDASMGGRALRGMNPEWMLAIDPKAFTPQV